jgi:hypothetical protein
LYCTKIHYLIKDWSQFSFGSWRNKLKNVVHTVLCKGARGGSLGSAIHDLYGESTNKTGGHVWIALYVKKQLKVIFNIPRLFE